MSKKPARVNLEEGSPEYSVFHAIHEAREKLNINAN